MKVWREAAPLLALDPNDRKARISWTNILIAWTREGKFVDSWNELNRQEAAILHRITVGFLKRWEQHEQTRKALTAG